MEGIEADFPGATALFMNGCGADCDPSPRSTIEAPKTHDEAMAVAVGQVLRRPMPRVTGRLTTRCSRKAATRETTR
jgi:neutral ceramidase